MIASVLPAILLAQGAPESIATAPLQSGQASSATRSSVDSPPEVSFREVSAQAGLTTVPHSSAERRYIVESMGGGGVALLDCENDGRPDIAEADASAGSLEVTNG